MPGLPENFLGNSVELHILCMCLPNNNQLGRVRMLEIGVQMKPNSFTMTTNVLHLRKKENLTWKHQQVDGAYMFTK